MLWNENQNTLQVGGISHQHVNVKDSLQKDSRCNKNGIGKTRTEAKNGTNNSPNDEHPSEGEQDFRKKGSNLFVSKT